MASAQSALFFRPRARSRNRAPLSILPSLFLPLVLLTTFCFLYLAIVGTESYLTQEVVQSKRRISHLEEENRRLSFQVVKLKSTARIEQFAVQEGMVFPEEATFIEVRQPTHSPEWKAAQRTPSGFFPWLKKLLQRFG